MAENMINLAAEAWARLLDGQSADSALPACCANVSVLRDVIYRIKREGGALTPALADDFHWYFGHVANSHPLSHESFTPLHQMAAQVEAYRQREGLRD